MAADELGEGRDHDRVAELGPDLDDFIQHVLHFVFFAEHFELMAQVGNHAAGNLVTIPGFVVFARRADGQTFFFGDPAKVLLDRFEHLFVRPTVCNRARADCCTTLKIDGCAEPFANGGTMCARCECLA